MSVNYIAKLIEKETNKVISSFFCNEIKMLNENFSFFESGDEKEVEVEEIESLRSKIIEKIENNIEKIYNLKMSILLAKCKDVVDNFKDEIDFAYEDLENLKWCLCNISELLGKIKLEMSDKIFKDTKKVFEYAGVKYGFDNKNFKLIIKASY